MLARPLRCGRRKSPTCPWPRASSTWWPSWTDTAGTWWPGGIPTLWKPGFCAVALARGKPEVFSTVQVIQLTQVLQGHGVKISMDGKGRYNDNIFVERL